MTSGTHPGEEQFIQVKVKVIPEQDKKAQRGSRGIAVIFL